MNIDPKLIRIFVSIKLIANHDKVDLQKTRQISIVARALGGGRSSKVQGPCQIKSCGRNEPNRKYFKLPAFPPEKRNVITSGDSNLNESSVVCQKCYSKVKRQPDFRKFQPRNKSLIDPSVLFLIALLSLNTTMVEPNLNS